MTTYAERIADRYPAECRALAQSEDRIRTFAADPRILEADQAFDHDLDALFGRVQDEGPYPTASDAVAESAEIVAAIEAAVEITRQRDAVAAGRA